MLNKPLSQSYRIYAEDVDYMGIVYHANHLKLFERARAELLRHAGLTLPELENQGIQFAIYEANIKYLKPLLLDDIATIFTTYSIERSTSLLFKQSMMNQNKVIISEADIYVACLNRQFKPTRIPKIFNTG